MALVLPGYELQPTQKPYEDIGRIGWYVLDTHTSRKLDWATLLLRMGYGEMILWEGTEKDSSSPEWKAINNAVGQIPAMIGLKLNEQGLAAGLTQWPESETRYSSQGDVEGAGTLIQVSPIEDFILNWYKSTNGLFYNTVSKCVYFPAEADGGAPNNAKIFLDIVRQLCMQSPPTATSYCGEWTRRSIPWPEKGWDSADNKQLLIVSDMAFTQPGGPPSTKIPVAPFLVSDWSAPDYTDTDAWVAIPDVFDGGGNQCYLTAEDGKGDLSTCISAATIYGYSPTFEAAYKRWLENCSPTVETITSAPVDSVNPAPVDTCSMAVDSNGYLLHWAYGGPCDPFRN